MAKYPAWAGATGPEVATINYRHVGWCTAPSVLRQSSLAELLRLKDTCQLSVHGLLACFTTEGAHAGAHTCRHVSTYQLSNEKIGEHSFFSCPATSEHKHLQG